MLQQVHQVLVDRPDDKIRTVLNRLLVLQVKFGGIAAGIDDFEFGELAGILVISIEKTVLDCFGDLFEAARKRQHQCDTLWFDIDSRLSSSRLSA